MDQKQAGKGPALEVELKFQIDAAAARKLRAAPWLKALQATRATSQALNAVYFDTPEQDLRNRAIAFRVRKEGRQFIQCVKTAGTFARKEWETPVSGFLPNPDPVRTDPELSGHIGADLLDRLQPAFETRIRRSSRLLRLDSGAEIAFDMDDGEIVSGDSTVPVHELELELKAGTPEDLFALARRITDYVPARLGARSKAERGYALSSGEPALWEKAKAPEFDAETSAEEALARTILASLRQLSANEDCVLNRSHIEGVHQMRVAIRRLRATLAIYRGLVPMEQHIAITERVKPIISALGPARDLDVFLAEILGPVQDYMAEEPSLALLRGAAEAARDRAYADAQAMIRAPEYTDTLLMIGDWVMRKGWRDQSLSPDGVLLFSNARVLAAALLDKRDRKLKKAGKRIRKMTSHERHELRLGVKKARYAADFFQTLYDQKVARAYCQRLSAVQDSLGLLNDVAVAHGLLDGLCDAAPVTDRESLRLASGLVLGWHTRILKDHEKDAFEAWDRYAKAQPYWVAGARD
ncbi:MAG: CHAD domain-containing protein [Rhodobacterales bacterium]|nr:CHAD domain-containing protein [Rhodobacterales bacterium]